MDEGAPSTAPLRICLVGPSLDILGGQSVQLARLLSRMQDVPGFEVGFLAVNPRLPGPAAALQRIRYVRTVVTSIAYGVSLLRRLGAYDVVHAFSASYWSFILAPLPAMIVGRLLGKTVILNYHSGEADDHLRRWRRTVLPAMRLAHEVVVPSGYLVDVFARHGVAAHAVPNFVDLGSLPFRVRTTLRPIFLSNRNLEPLYNVACLLRAFQRVQLESPDARLIVAGDGSQRGALEALATSLSLRNVDFRGRVAPDRMGELYDEADIYLNAPNIDNMPLSVIEAFAAGLPVVSTDAGGIPHIVRDGQTGLLSSCNDDRALAASALRLLRDPGLAVRLAAAAREECLARYVWPAVRDEWERTWVAADEMAHGRPSAAALAPHPQ